MQVQMRLLVVFIVALFWHAGEVFAQNIKAGYSRTKLGSAIGAYTGDQAAVDARQGNFEYICAPTRNYQNGSSVIVEAGAVIAAPKNLTNYPSGGVTLFGTAVKSQLCKDIAVVPGGNYVAILGEKSVYICSESELRNPANDQKLISSIGCQETTIQQSASKTGPVMALVEGPQVSGQYLVFSEYFSGSVPTRKLRVLDLLSLSTDQNGKVSGAWSAAQDISLQGLSTASFGAQIGDLGSALASVTNGSVQHAVYVSDPEASALSSTGLGDVYVFDFTNLGTQSTASPVGAQINLGTLWGGTDKGGRFGERVEFVASNPPKLLVSSPFSSNTRDIHLPNECVHCGRVDEFELVQISDVNQQCGFNDIYSNYRKKGEWCWKKRRSWLGHEARRFYGWSLNAYMGLQANPDVSGDAIEIMTVGFGSNAYQTRSQVYVTGGHVWDSSYNALSFDALFGNGFVIDTPHSEAKGNPVTPIISPKYMYRNTTLGESAHTVGIAWFGTGQEKSNQYIPEVYQMKLPNLSQYARLNQLVKQQGVVSLSPPCKGTDSQSTPPVLEVSEARVGKNLELSIITSDPSAGAILAMGAPGKIPDPLFNTGCTFGVNIFSPVTVTIPGIVTNTNVPVYLDSSHRGRQVVLQALVLTSGGIALTNAVTVGVEG